jgi:putative transposase
MARLKRAHKALSRKRKGSKNRDKARIRVARLYEKIGNTRRDFLHKLSTRIIRENQTVAVEDLNVVGMLANHRLAEGISDSGWAEFVRQLRYKCEWYGRKLIRVERFFPSSKRCSECGKVVHTLPLDIRFWTCPACGVSHDRDTNAARNILAEGHSVIARGDDVRPKRRRARRRGCLGSGNRPVACA